MRIGSLFSGYGGLDMAVEQVTGAPPAWFCEFESAPSKVLAAHWPSVPNLGDITTVDWSAVEPVDIITGGSPCQDLSHAGRRAGMTDGTRSNLWVQMREAVAVLRPSMVIWENVRGAYSACADSEMGRCPRCVDPDSGAGHAPYLRALGRVLGDLSDLGYDCRWHGLRAADIGAPHERLRVFVVAHARRLRGQQGRQSAPGQAQGWWPQPLSRVGGGVDAPAGTAGDGRHEGWTEPARQQGRPDATQRGAFVADASGIGSQRRREHNNLAGAPGTGETDSEQRQRHGHATDHRGATDWGQYAPAIHRWEHVIGRPAPAPTEPGTRGGQRLSPRFVEWMMGLPAGWVTDVDISRNDQLKVLGNGVVPQQAVAAIRHMTAQERAA